MNTKPDARTAAKASIDALLTTLREQLAQPGQSLLPLLGAEELPDLDERLEFQLFRLRLQGADRVCLREHRVGRRRLRIERGPHLLVRCAQLIAQRAPLGARLIEDRVD